MEAPADEALTPLDRIHAYIETAPKKTAEEFSRTQNSWLACFGSSVFRIETALSSAKTTLTPEDFQTYHDRLERLKEELEELRQQFPDRDTIPDPKIQEALMKKLNLFEEYKPEETV